MSKVVISFDESDKLIGEIVARLKPPAKTTLSRRRKILSYAGVGVLIGAFLIGYPLVSSWLNRPGSLGSEKKLEITELIRDVKKQVVEASTKAEEKGETPFFRLRSVDLEINYTVKVSGTSSGKAEFYVLTAENSSQTDLEKAQKIVLHLDAIQMYQQTIVPLPGEKIDQTNSPVVDHDPTPPPKTSKP